MWTSIVDSLESGVGLAFVAGLVGSAHCVGMCGALVLTVGRQAGTAARSAQLWYAGGRVLAYAFLGALFGMAGGLVLLPGFFEGAQGWFLMGAGTVVIALAVLRLGPWGEFTPGASFGGRLYERIRPWLPAESSPALFLLLGILNSLVPCGLLYTMELRAMGAGSALDGAGLMLAFGLGTAPALIVLGSVGGRLTTSHRFWMDKLGSVVLIVMGAQLIYHGVRHLGWWGPAVEGCH